MPVALDYARARAKRQWDYTHSHGPFAWLFRRIGAMKPVTGVWICQYASADWDRAHCTGEAIRVWRYDAEGLTSVDCTPELDKSNAIASATPVISFCLDETAERMIYQEWYGLRAGFGSVLALNKGGDWVTEKHAWIS